VEVFEFFFLPCFCFPFKYLGHVLRIHKFLDTRDLLSIEAKSEDIFIIVGLAGYSLAVSEKLKSPLAIEAKKRSQYRRYA